jgi:hypothetical protein
VPIKSYVARPVTVRAIEWTGDNFDEIRQFCNGLARLQQINGEKVLFIETVNGTSRAHVGDYIIWGTQGEFYPVDKRVIESKYEELAKDE